MGNIWLVGHPQTGSDQTARGLGMVNQHRDWNPPSYVPSKNQAPWAFPGTDPVALSGLRVIRPEPLGTTRRSATSTGALRLLHQVLDVLFVLQHDLIQ